MPVKKATAKKAVKKPAKKATKKAVKATKKVAAKKPAKKAARKPKKVQAPKKDVVVVAPVVDPSGVVTMTPVPDDVLNK